MKSLISVIIIAILAYCTLQSCVIDPNLLETLPYNPKLIKTVQNGQKLLIGNVNAMEDRDYIYVANLKGTPYEMGFAMGQLFAQEMHDNLKQFFEYYGQEFKKVINQKLPKFLQPIVGSQAINVLKRLLQLNIIITKKYTNPRYYQQIRGISEGAKISFLDVASVNMLPELVKAACTVAGIWNVASAENRTLHMRALDWDYKNPLNKYPLISVYHPSNEKWQTHANIGWVGMVGSITGISKKVSLGEKVWISKKNPVAMTRYGNPWNYVFRDVLYEAVDLKSAIEIFTHAHRTCAIHVGLGSVEDHSFRMMLYAEQRLDIFDDTNYTYSATHPKKAGIAFFDKHVQPSTDDCVGNLLTNNLYYGKWNMESFWRVVGNSHKTGDTQLVVFDLEQLKGLVSYSKYHGDIKAFARKPIEVDFNELFKTF